MGDKTTVVVQPPKQSDDVLNAAVDTMLRSRVEQLWPLDTYDFKGDEILQTKKRAALYGYAMRGLISEACRMVRVARQTWYDWIKEDEAFAKAAIEGKEFAMETLEAMAYSRGYTMSDPLLQFMLKHGKPQVFRDTIAHVGANGAPLPAALTNVNVSPVLILPDNHRQDAPVAVPQPEPAHEEPQPNGPPSGGLVG